MYISELSKAINNAIGDCIDCGSGKGAPSTDSKIMVHAEWETWDGDDAYDVVGVYIYKDNNLKMYFQEIETKMKI